MSEEFRYEEATEIKEAGQENPGQTGTDKLQENDELKENRDFQQNEQPRPSEKDREEIRELKKSLRVTQALCLIMILLLLSLLVGGGILVSKIMPKVNPLIAQITQVAGVAEQIRKVDLNAVAKDVSDINDTLSQVNWDEVTRQLNSIDVESMNATLRSLQSLDPEELEKAIENMNDAADTLSKLGRLFGH